MEAETNEERFRRLAKELERNHLFRILEALMAQPDATYLSYGLLLSIFCADPEIAAGIPFDSDAESLNWMNPYPGEFVRTVHGILFLSNEQIKARRMRPA